jgi:hypothetical protein
MATGLNPKIIFKIKNQALMMKIRILNVIVLQCQKFNMQVCFKYRARIEGAFFSEHLEREVQLLVVLVQLLDVNLQPLH